MKIELITVSGRKIFVSDIREFCFTQSKDAACDSLWAYFRSEKSVDEISTVKAYENDKLIFNGLCDCQKTFFTENGCENYFYARSTASVLVDNEAEPYTYEMPSVNQLCFNIVRKYGFVNCIENVYSKMKYEVTKGTSCYGAISDFVSLLTGCSITITPENEIMLMRYSDSVRSINNFDIISLVQTINRSEPYSQILFKKSFSESGYSMHTESLFGKENGIDRSVYINLSSLPQWQRENTVLKRLKESYDTYKIIELKVSGYVSDALLQRYSYGELDDIYALCEKKYVCDKSGGYTKLRLRKIVDIKEITYVD